MTRQDKINYLNKYRFAKAEAIRLDEQLKRLRSERERTTPTYTVAHGSSGDGNRIETLTEKILALESLLWDKRLDYITLYADIEAAIDSVADEREKRILRLRYIEGYDFMDIADNIFCGHRHTTRLHSQAIKKMSLNVLSCV